ncbi:hypothetical protein BofuT4_uP000710.1 [Botrytis cinerea T4]|uniref:Uncharacterized protein n=1 Tax=Botryotinia fuckeliana (strain T4) TaxID=999810 RepID=G2YLX6_BOTF4|nr:hypothetical protein BofuT4_uP000710.1 [Botrytis cinerea T4]
MPKRLRSDRELFKSRPNQFNVNSNLLVLVLWASGNNQAVKSIAKF